MNKIYKNTLFQLIKRVYYYNSIYINIRKISSEILDIVYIVFVSLINYISILFVYLHFCILIYSSFLYFYNILSTVRQYCADWTINILFNICNKNLFRIVNYYFSKNWITVSELIISTTDIEQVVNRQLFKYWDISRRSADIYKNIFKIYLCFVIRAIYSNKFLYLIVWYYSFLHKQ